MTNQQILRMAFLKAKKNGWESGGYEYIITSDFCDVPVRIFNHDFAKAFWSDTHQTEMGDSEWQVRLQEMVLEKSPIKYLEQFL